MSERTTDHKSLHISCCLTTTLLDSSKIFLSNPQIFLSIFTLTTLPLSLLLITLSLSSHPIQSHINHLQSTALYSSTRFEARHVWQESRAGAVSLLKTKALFSIPSYLLSLLAVVTAVNSAALAYHGKRPSFQAAVKAVKESWKRPFVTSLCVYAVMLSFSAVIRTCLAVTVPSAAVSTVLVAAVGAVTEIYLMSVLSLGLVVSVMEDRFGFDAIRVGSRIMQGRRFNGWILSGLFVLMTGGIGLEVKGLVNGQDLFGKSYWSTTSTVMIVIMGFGEKVGLVCLLGVITLWSYVVTTVFYCECRKKHVIIKSENEIGNDDETV